LGNDFVIHQPARPQIRSCQRWWLVHHPHEQRMTRLKRKRNAEDAEFAERGAEEISSFVGSASCSANFAPPAFRFPSSKLHPASQLSLVSPIPKGRWYQAA
jgi:hypothetical protein